MEPIADTSITGREGIGRACCSGMVAWRMSGWDIPQTDISPQPALLLLPTSGSSHILILLAKSSNQCTDAAEGRDGGRISRRFRLVSDFASSIYFD